MGHGGGVLRCQRCGTVRQEAAASTGGPIERKIGPLLRSSITEATLHLMDGLSHNSDWHVQRAVDALLDGLVANQGQEEVATGLADEGSSVSIREFLDRVGAADDWVEEIDPSENKVHGDPGEGLR